MKLIIATLTLLGVALLLGCESQPQPLPSQPVIVPLIDYGNNPPPRVDPPIPEKEPQLLIFNKKIELLTTDTVAISFETNIPATSNIKLLTSEVTVDTQQITDKVKYHYYKFINLKQVTEYYVTIEAVAQTKDTSVYVFRTLSKVDPYQPPPQYYFYNPYYYPYVPYVPPIPTPIVFWAGSVTIEVTTP